MGVDRVRTLFNEDVLVGFLQHHTRWEYDHESNFQQGSIASNYLVGKITMTGTNKFVVVRIEILKFLQPLNVLWEGCIERIVADV